MAKRHFQNMYLTTTISVMLVLFLVGLECVVILSAHNLMNHVRENLTMTLVLRPSAQSADCQDIEDLLEDSRYCHDYSFVSADQALEEHVKSLGEDPTKFLGYNPLSASYEIHLNAEYAQSDSIAQIADSLQTLKGVEQVIYQKDIVKMLDDKVNEVSIILISIALVLLLIAFALIVNTIRLHVYSKRFLINTMRLVGATPWVIKGPFVRQNIIMGFIAGVLALGAISGAYYYVKVRLGVILFPLTWMNIGLVSVVVLALGMLITCGASLFAVNRYIRMKTERMYEM